MFFVFLFHLLLSSTEDPHITFTLPEAVNTRLRKKRDMKQHKGNKSRKKMCGDQLLSAVHLSVMLSRLLAGCAGGYSDLLLT